jgi:hypothetical protein
MIPVKVNIYLSHTPDDKAQLDVLLRWLYPMRDEVNLWYNDPPKKPPELPLPWQLLLFWYTPPDMTAKYARILQARREKAHIYLFLTSYASISDKNIEPEIDIAVNRRIAGDDFTGPFVFPLILSASTWKDTSRLAGFKALARGIPLASFKQKDEGYLAITEEIAELVKLLQRRLGEAKFYQSRLAAADTPSLGAGKRSLPYLGESDGDLEYQEVTYFEPSEWLGWSIILFLFISLISSLMPEKVLRTRYENAKAANDFGPEYYREHPMSPPADTIDFPPVE